MTVLRDPDGPGIRLLLAGDHPEEGRFPGAVRTDDPDDPAGRKGKGHLVDQEAVAVGLAHPLRLDDELPQAGSGRDVDLQIPGAGLRFLGEQLLVGTDPGLGFGMAALGRHADPLQFPLEGLLPLAFRFLLLPEPVLLLLQPGGVVPLPGDPLAPVQLQDPAGDVVEEVAVMGHGDHGARVPLEMVLQPGDGLGVEVVRRFVEEQDVGVLEEEPAEGDPPPLAAGEDLHRGFARRTAQRVHRHLQAGIEVPGIQVVQFLLDLRLPVEEFVHLLVRHRLGEFLIDRVELVEEIDRFLHPLLHDLPDRLRLVQLRLLLQEADGMARGEDRLPDEIRIDAGQDPEQRALARAVQAQDADLRPVEIGEIDVLQDRFFLVDLAHSDHGVDDFVGRLVGHGIPPR